MHEDIFKQNQVQFDIAAQIVIYFKLVSFYIYFRFLAKTAESKAGMCNGLDDSSFPCMCFVSQLSILKLFMTIFLFNYSKFY